jgi:hypothetical protein
MNISTPPLYLSVCTKTRKWAIMYMCGGGIDFHFVSTITISDFGTIPTVWYFFVLLHFIDFLKWYYLLIYFELKQWKLVRKKNTAWKKLQFKRCQYDVILNYNLNYNFLKKPPKVGLNSDTDTMQPMKKNVFRKLYHFWLHAAFTCTFNENWIRIQCESNTLIAFTRNFF